MPCHYRTVAIVAVMILVAVAPPASGKALEDQRWIEVRTANFRVHSLLGDKETIELTRRLEMFRAAVSLLTNVHSTDSAIPTNIYALRGSRDFIQLGLELSFVGRFLPGLRSNTIIFRHYRGMDETTIVFHEYVHFLLRNHGRLQYPMWYDEGFAEYLSATKIDDTYFEVGVFPKHVGPSLEYFRWIPMRRVLSADEHFEKWNRERKAMFYVEAWALVHYLRNRPDRGESFAQDLAHYLELVEAETGVVGAFEDAFGVTVDKLDRKVKAYLKKRRFTFFRIDMDKLLYDFRPEVVTLSRQQTSLALAQLALRMEELDPAERWFTIAATHELTRPRAEAGLGDVLKFRGEFEAARPHFEKAVALAPDDPYCQLDLAEFWHDRAKDTSESDKHSEYLNRARNHYVKAWKLDDSMPETYAMYGQTFQMGGQRFDKAIEMLEKAQSILPSDLDIRLMLAEAYAGAGRKGEAIEAARSVLAWSHDEESAKRAKEILARLDSATE